MSKFYLRRNSRIAFVQMAIQKELIGNMHISSFLSAPDLWAWGKFDVIFFRKLYQDLEQNWNLLTELFKSKSNKESHYLCPILKGIIKCGLLELKIYKIDPQIIVPEYIRIGKSLLGIEYIKSIYIFLN